MNTFLTPPFLNPEDRMTRESDISSDKGVRMAHEIYIPIHLDNEHQISSHIEHNGRRTI
jgi:hypothetical protein